MRIQKLLSVISSVVDSITKKTLVIEITGISPEGKKGWFTRTNGTVSDLPELVSHFESLKSGSIWLTEEGRNRELGKRILLCRKGISFR